MANIPFVPNHGFHRHDETRIILFLSGVYRERTFTSTARYAAGDILIRPAHMAHDGAVKGTARYWGMTLPTRELRKLCGIDGWGAFRTALAPSDFIAARTTKISVAELLSGLEFCRVSGPQKSSLMSPAAIQLSEIGNEDSLATIAERSGMTPWAFSRAFKKEYGLSPQRYRLLARLEAAMGLLAETDKKITTIAAETGFTDHSHLCGSLRSETAKTPSSFRSAARLQ